MRQLSYVIAVVATGLGLALMMATGCLFPFSKETNAGGGGSGMTTTATSSTGGTGGAMPCSLTAPCEDDHNPCTTEECKDGFCVSTKLDQNPGPGATECITVVCNKGIPTTTVHGGGPCGTGLTCNAVGECTGCMDVAACPAPPECQVVSCTSGVCKVQSAPMGTSPTKVMDTLNDCKKPICDSNGSVVFTLDAADLPVADSNLCTDEACDMTGPVHPPSAKGTACTSVTKPNAKVCDGNNTCVECLINGDCAMGVQPSCDTATNTCISCSDGKQNGSETGLDCGGTCSLKCDGDPCGGAPECKSLACDDNVCCHMDCSATCLACGLPGNKGACTPVPKGLEDIGCTGSGKACTGAGACASGVTGKAGTICSADNKCYTGACNGMCRLPNFAPCALDMECASLSCVSSVCKACSLDADCSGAKCDLLTSRCLIADGGVCFDNKECGGTVCDPATNLCGHSIGLKCSNGAECSSRYCNAQGKCAACTPATQATDCPGQTCDGTGSCRLKASAPCTADDQCTSTTCSTTFPRKCQ